jgi:hypothetical protein
MRFSTLSPKAAREQRRERWRRDRSTAQTLGNAFPQVERMRIDLSFAEADVHTPVPQAYVLQPPANAFFEFPCPYADCDGQFDLTAAVTAVLADSVPQVEGGLECTGARIRDRTGKHLCQLHLDYIVRVDYRLDAEP